MFYTIPTARVIFMAKTSLYVFSLRQEQVWTFSVLGDRIYELRGQIGNKLSASYQ